MTVTLDDYARGADKDRIRAREYLNNRLQGAHVLEAVPNSKPYIPIVAEAIDRGIKVLLIAPTNAGAEWMKCELEDTIGRSIRILRIPPNRECPINASKIEKKPDLEKLRAMLLPAKCSGCEAWRKFHDGNECGVRQVIDSHGQWDVLIVSYGKLAALMQAPKAKVDAEPTTPQKIMHEILLSRLIIATHCDELWRPRTTTLHLQSNQAGREVVAGYEHIAKAFPGLTNIVTDVADIIDSIKPDRDRLIELASAADYWKQPTSEIKANPYVKRGKKPDFASFLLNCELLMTSRDEYDLSPFSVTHLHDLYNIRVAPNLLIAADRYGKEISVRISVHDMAFEKMMRTFFSGVVHARKSVILTSGTLGSCDYSKYFPKKSHVEHSRWGINGDPADSTDCMALTVPKMPKLTSKGRDAWWMDRNIPRLGIWNEAIIETFKDRKITFVCQSSNVMWEMIKSAQSSKAKGRRAEKTPSGWLDTIHDNVRWTYYRAPEIFSGAASAEVVVLIGMAEPTKADFSLIADDNEAGRLLRAEARNADTWNAVNLARNTEGKAGIVVLLHCNAEEIELAMRWGTQYRMEEKEFKGKRVRLVPECKSFLPAPKTYILEHSEETDFLARIYNVTHPIRDIFSSLQTSISETHRNRLSLNSIFQVIEALLRKASAQTDIQNTPFSPILYSYYGGKGTFAEYPLCRAPHETSLLIPLFRSQRQKLFFTLEIHCIKDLYINVKKLSHIVKSQEKRFFCLDREDKSLDKPNSTEDHSICPIFRAEKTYASTFSFIRSFLTRTDECAEMIDAKPVRKVVNSRSLPLLLSRHEAGNTVLACAHYDKDGNTTWGTFEFTEQREQDDTPLLVVARRCALLLRAATMFAYLEQNDVPFVLERHADNHFRIHLQFTQCDAKKVRAFLEELALGAGIAEIGITPHIGEGARPRTRYSTLPLSADAEVWNGDKWVNAANFTNITMQRLDLTTWHPALSAMPDADQNITEEGPTGNEIDSRLNTFEQNYPIDDGDELLGLPIDDDYPDVQKEYTAESWAAWEDHLEEQLQNILVSPGWYCDDCLEFMYHVFATRPDLIYQQYAETDVKYGYLAKRRPPYMSVPAQKTWIDRHMSGAITIGAPCIDENGNVKWGCYDIDAHQQPKETGVTLIKKIYWAELKTMKLLSYLHKKGIPYILEQSGSTASYHIWVSVVPVDAKIAMWTFRAIAQAAGVIDIEVNPKQGKAGAKGSGNQVKLPFGKHQAHKGRSKLYIQGKWVGPRWSREGPALPGEFSDIMHRAIDIRNVDIGAPALVKIKDLPEIYLVEDGVEYATMESIAYTGGGSGYPGIRRFYVWALDQELTGEEGHLCRVYIVREFLNARWSHEQIAMLFAKQGDFDYDLSLKAVKYIAGTECGNIQYATLWHDCPTLATRFVDETGYSLSITGKASA